MKLNAFDTLLVYGPSKKYLPYLIGDFIVLGKVEARLKERFWWVSVYVVLISIFFASIGYIPIMKGAFISVVILLCLKIISAQELSIHTLAGHYFDSSIDTYWHSTPKDRNR